MKTVTILVATASVSSMSAWAEPPQQDAHWRGKRGAAHNREKYTALTCNSAEILEGKPAAYRIAEATTITRRPVVDPGLQDSGEYRAAFDASPVTALAGNGNRQVALSDQFNSDAPFGNERNAPLPLSGIG